jgi:phosphopantothenoylcysteine decarboxylase / phosphopantothenate---cysteine ligase
MNSSAKRRKKKLKILKNKSILLGVSGGVAAYKSIELVRRLKEEGASVAVVMTDASRQFVTPLSLEIASQNAVYVSLFATPMAHIRLPSEADLMIVAPATANLIGKFANGIADDLLSTCLLAYRGRVIVAPSMNWRMYENEMFQENLRKITSLPNVIQVGPEKGSLACGEEGIGRMTDIEDLVDTAKAALSKKDLAGEKIVVTAGPTREYLDPVRFISNRSSGKMGYSLARAARNRGAEVTLISGPSSLKRPGGVKFFRVETGREMEETVQREISEDTAALIMTAAVADFSPVGKSESKIEKTEELQLAFRAVPDIISSIAARKIRPFLIGFAAETGNDIRSAAEKMKRKNMDMIVFNDVSEPGAGFDVDTNRVVIIDRDGEKAFPRAEKESVAEAILDRFIEIRT